MTKIISYNVNGIRSAISKGFVEWAMEFSPDIICLQEIKAMTNQLDLSLFEKAGYTHHYWHSAEKKGYSGVAILSKKKPIHVEVGFGKQIYDMEGRILRADYDEFSVISVYMPSGTSGGLRQAFKFEFLDFFQDYIDKLKKTKQKLIICGDWNICHKSIDIHNPISNAKSSGFLPEEREWIGKFIESGFIDSFRNFNEDAHNYTWWSQRAGSRGKNLGWRIDYNMVSDNLKSELKGASLLPEVRHSDHCPILLEIGD